MLIDYIQCGDFLIPNIVLNEPPRELTEPITKYGAMRRSFLKTHRPIEYSALLLSERLFPHLRDVQQAARFQPQTKRDKLERIIDGAGVWGGSHNKHFDR